MTATMLELSVESTLESVSTLAQSVREWAETAGCTTDELFALELAVSEAGSNVVRHAYRDEAGHQLRLRLRVDSVELVLSILDEGLAVPEDRRNPPPPPDDVRDPASVSEGGRGIFLIKEVMDDVTFETEGASNRLVMKRRRVRTSAEQKGPQRP